MFVQKRDLTSASVNFPFVHVNFGQLSVLQQDILSTSVNSLSVRGTFHQLSMHPRALPLTSVNFICVRGTFQIVPLGRCLSSSSTFRLVVVSSINFPYNHGTIRQFSVRPWYLLSTFHTFAEYSVNFRQLSVHPRDLSSTFRALV